MRYKLIYPKPNQSYLQFCHGSKLSFFCGHLVITADVAKLYTGIVRGEEEIIIDLPYKWQVDSHQDANIPFMCHKLAWLWERGERFGL